MKEKLMTLLILVALISSSFVAINPAMASPTTVEVINPATGTNEFFFDTTTLHLGDTFYARIVVKDVADLFIYQIMIGFDPDLLNVVEMTYSSDVGDYVFQGKTTIPTTPEINNASGYVLGGVSLLSSADKFTGSGTLCMVKFQVMKEPPRLGQLGPSVIDIITTPDNPKKPGFYTFLLNPDLSEMPYTDVDGTYKFTWAKPTTLPHLAVVPSYKKVGGGPPITMTPITFSVDIWIYDVDPKWQLIGVQFRVCYNDTLLEVLEISEGTFMNNSTWAPYGTVFANTTYPPTHDPYDPAGEYGQALVGIVIWPTGPNGTWVAPFPEGSGKLATITFNVTHQEEFPWIGTTPLDIRGLWDSGLRQELKYFFDSDYMDIDNGPDVDGKVDIMGYVLGLQIDVYTQYAYMDPELGGVGPNAPSDAFGPQATVILEAKVTYNLDPVQFKPVTFYIVGPSGNFTQSRVALTDANGIARIEFGLPWPCADYNDTFGIWNVLATVEVRESVKNDTLQFRVGWLVEIVKVTMDKDFYHKGDHPVFTVTYKTISRQPRSGILTMVVYDELAVPIGEVPAIPFTVGGAPLLGEKEYTQEMTCLTIPKWAFIGTGHVYTNAYNVPPAEGGVAYCPENVVEISIQRP
jgi:hypothetical protein